MLGYKLTATLKPYSKYDKVDLTLVQKGSERQIMTKSFN